MVTPSYSETISPPEVTENVQSALNDLNLVNTNSNVFNEMEPKLEDNIDKTQVIDINAIKEAAKSDEVPSDQVQSQVPNFDSLLKVEESQKVQEPENKPLEFPKIGEPINFGNKNYPSLEDESANMNFGIQTQPGFTSISSNIETIPTPVDNTVISIENNSLEDKINIIKNILPQLEKDGSKVEMQEIDLIDEYQIIIRLKKEPKI